MATLEETSFLRPDETQIGNPIEWHGYNGWPYGYGPYFLTDQRVIARWFDPFNNEEDYCTFWSWEEDLWRPLRLEVGLDGRLYLTVDQHGEERVYASNGLYIEEV